MYLDLNTDGKPKDNRMVVIILAAVAGVMLLFAGISRHWIGHPQFGVFFGPRGCEGCGTLVSGFDNAEEPNMTNGAFVSKLRARLNPPTEDAEYAAAASDEADKVTSSVFAPMGWLTFAASIIGGVSLLVCAFLAFQKKKVDLKVAPTTIALLALLIGMITACIFVATKPLGPGGVGVQYTFWIYGAGLVMGLASAQMLAKLLRPEDPDLLDGAMQPDAY
jgi:hypothetical protein